MSRAFGDIQFKGKSSSSSSSAATSSEGGGGSKPGTGGPVIATPDICAEVITPMTEFAILATDGLWDVVTPQGAVNCVRKRLAKKGSDLQNAAQDLVQEALSKGSVDNVTVVIMSFHLTNIVTAAPTPTAASASASEFK